MCTNYRRLFEKLIVEKMDSIIIKYKPEQHTYSYQGYNHQATEGALDDVTNLVIDDIVFYTFSEKEIVDYNTSFGLLEDLREAAKYAYLQRLPERENANSDGLLGEVLLDLLIQTYSNTAKKLVVRAKHTEIGTKKEITGYDALYFTKENEEVFFWLGQAKAGEKAYCKSSIIDDLMTKYKNEYFLKTAFYIADKKDTDELDNLLMEINSVCFKAQKLKWSKDEKTSQLFQVMKNNNIKIKIPCLIAYTKTIYNDTTKLKEKLQKEINNIVKEFDIKTFPVEMDLEYEILFWIFPVENISYIRENLIKLKKEAI